MPHPLPDPLPDPLPHPLPHPLPDRLPDRPLCSKSPVDPSGKRFLMTPVKDRGLDCLRAHFEYTLTRIMTVHFE